MRLTLTSAQYLILVLLIGFSGLHAQSLKDGFGVGEKNFINGQLILKVKDEYRDRCKNDQINIAAVQEAFAEIGGLEIQKIFPHHTPPAQSKSKAGELADLSLIYRLSFDKGQELLSAVARLDGLTEISYAEPAYIHQLFYTPDDPFADSTETSSSNIPWQWGLGQIRAYEAWDIQRGDSSILIGVVDSGHKGQHEDMQDNLGLNVDDPIDGIDNDLDGFVDNYAGWDFGGNTLDGQGDNDPNVGNVHGFFVAGILGATTDNGIGIAGSSFNCRYLPIKAAPDDSITAVFYGYEGIVYAVDQGAQIVNCSWGGRDNSRFGQDVVQYATVNRSAALIVAAGNSRRDEKFYPAAYPQCISVANSFYQDVIFPNSTFNYSVDIAAPGGSVLSTFQDTYAFFGGTSAAAPMAAGALGIVLAHFDQLTGFQAAQRMRVTADEIYTVNDSSIYEDRLGNGRVNLYRALTDPLKPSIRTETFEIKDLDGDSRFLSGDTLLISVDFINYLHPSNDLYIQLSVPNSLQSFVNVLEGDLVKGQVNMWDRFDNGTGFKVVLSSSLPYNVPLALKLNYSDDANSYEDFEYLEFRVNKTWLDIEENLLSTSVNSQGNFGFNALGQLTEGLGVRYEEGENALFEGGFLIGNSSAVSDRIRNNLFSADQDFAFSQLVKEIENPERSDFQALSKFDDATSLNPLGLAISQHTYAFSDTAHDDYVIFQFEVENISGQMIADLYAGLFADWDIFAGNFNRNFALFDRSNTMVYAKDAQGIDPRHYGMTLLTDQDFKAYAASLPSPGFNFSNTAKFIALSNEPDTATATAGLGTQGRDIAQFISGGPFSMAIGAKDTLAFAILAADDLAGLQGHADAAKSNYFCRVLDRGPNEDFLFAEVSQAREILFSDQNANANTWSWDFGDGNSAMSKNPIHVYSSAGSYEVNLRVSDGVCSRDYKQKILVRNNVSTEPDPELARLSIFPNPARENFLLKLEGSWQGEIQIEMYGIDGKRVYTRTAEAAQIYTLSVDRGSLPAGIYALTLRHKDFQISRKINWVD
ncbi:MAG: S8 family serine peptidase [Bacteroidia bacterium]|nr:S8 family serine peptidase [Bacteroidia bacterium]